MKYVHIEFSFFESQWVGKLFHTLYSEAIWYNEIMQFL